MVFSWKQNKRETVKCTSVPQQDIQQEAIDSLSNDIQYSYHYLHRCHVIEGMVQFLTDGFVLEFLCIKLICTSTHRPNKGVFKGKERKRKAEITWKGMGMDDKET